MPDDVAAAVERYRPLSDAEILSMELDVAEDERNSGLWWKGVLADLRHHRTELRAVEAERDAALERLRAAEAALKGAAGLLPVMIGFTRGANAIGSAVMEDMISTHQKIIREALAALRGTAPA